MLSEGMRMNRFSYTKSEMSYELFSYFLQKLVSSQKLQFSGECHISLPLVENVHASGSSRRPKLY